MTTAPYSRPHEAIDAHEPHADLVEAAARDVDVGPGEQGGDGCQAGPVHERPAPARPPPASKPTAARCERKADESALRQPSEPRPNAAPRDGRSRGRRSRRSRRSRRPRVRRRRREAPASTETSADGEPGRRGRKAQSEAQSVVGQGREALGVRVGDEGEQRDGPQVAARRARAGRPRSREEPTQTAVNSHTSLRPRKPAGSSRPAVRGLRASMPASIRRLRAIAGAARARPSRR